MRNAIKKIVLVSLSLVILLGVVAAPRTASALSTEDKVGAFIPAYGIYRMVTGQSNYTQGAVDALKSEFGTMAHEIVNTSLRMLGNLTLQIFSFFLYVSGIALNASIKLTIVNAKQFIDSITAINVTWALLRDMANIGFIFFLLYVGISTILQRNSRATKEILVNLVIAALFINFSLFFTKVVIDASNILAIEFHKGIVGNAASTDSLDYGLSSIFRDSMKLQSIYDYSAANVTADQKAAANLADTVTFVVSTFMGVVLFLIAGVVFMAAAIMLVWRFVVLVFLMILSPLAFLSMVFPKFQGSRWWSTLLNQAFFAPIYLMLTWIALYILRGSGLNGVSTGEGGVLAVTNNLLNSSGTVQWSQALSGLTTAAASLIISYVIVIGFFVFALVVAKRLGAYGADGAIKLGGAAVFGTVGFVGRQTAGRAMHKIANSDTMKQMRNSTGLTSLPGRYVANKVKDASEGSYDMRKSGVMGAISSSSGVNFGSGSSTSFAKQKEDEKKREKDYKAGERKKADVATINSGLEALQISAGTTRTPEQQQAIDDMERALNSMSDKELLSLGTKTLKKKEIITRLNPRQLEAIRKHEDFAEQDKDEMLNTRYEDLRTSLDELKKARTTGNPTAITTAEKNLEDKLKKLENKELELIDPSFIKEPDIAQRLSKKQADYVQDSDKFVHSQKEAVKTHRTKPLLDAIAAGNLAEVKSIISKKPPAETADLDASILTKDFVIASLGRKQLEAIAKDSKLQDSDVKIIRDYISRYPLHPAYSYITKAVPGSYWAS